MKPRSQMTEDEIEQGARELNEALQGVGELALILEPYELIVLISHVQLALRHPQANGPASQLAERITRRLIESLPEAARSHMLAGFEPKYDLPF